MPFNLKDIFIQSYKAATPGINTAVGFPVYDTLIAPNTRAFETLDSLMNELESNIDYSTFFNSDGVLVSEDKYLILKNNLFLGDGMAMKGRGLFLLEFSSLQGDIILNSPVVLVRENIQFVIPSGTYNLPVHSITGRVIRYGVTAVSIEIGSEVPAVTAGEWALLSGELPLNCSRVFTLTATSPGAGNAGVLTLENLPLLISRKTLDSKDSILAALNSITTSAGIVPDKMSVAGYEDPEYMSGIVPFQDEDDNIKQFRFGGYADTRFHKGCVAAEFYFDGADTYAGRLYRYTMNNPVYAVISVRTWIEGSDGSDVPFTFDYVHNRITTAHRKVRVMVLTTDPQAWSHVKQAFSTMYSSGGSIKLVPYMAVRYFVDTDCVDAGVVDDVNTSLRNFLDKGPSPFDVSFDMIKTNVRDVTGITLTKVKYLYPDNTGGELTSGVIPVHSINYAPSEFEVPVPLTLLNVIAAGGYRG